MTVPIMTRTTRTGPMVMGLLTRAAQVLLSANGLIDCRTKTTTQATTTVHLPRKQPHLLDNLYNHHHHHHHHHKLAHAHILHSLNTRWPHHAMPTLTPMLHVPESMGTIYKGQFLLIIIIKPPLCPPPRPRPRPRLRPYPCWLNHATPQLCTELQRLR